MRRAIALAVLSATSGFALAAGTMVASATLVCPAGISPPSVYCAEVPPPSATTEAATEVTPTSAALKGTINTFSAATTYWFEYGTTTAYGSKTPEASLPAAPGQPASATSSSVSAAAGNLAPSTTYHFRLVAKNAGGITQGADQTFKTVDESGLVLRIKGAIRAIGDRSISLPVHCAKKPRCAGTIMLEPVGHKASLSRAATRIAAARTVYGRAKYSLAYGANGSVHVTLTAAARQILLRHGHLTVDIVAVFEDPKVATVGKATITATPRPRRVTHAKRRPGFTG